MKKKVLISAAVSGLTLAPALSFVTSCSKSSISEAHILSINDFHGAAPGYGDDYFDLTNMNNPGAIRLAAEFEEIRAKYPGTITIACGDLNAGEGFSTCEQARTFYPVCKALGITYSTVGNHAWEWGADPLEDFTFDNLGRTSDTVGNYFMTSNVLNGPEYRKKSWCADPKSFAFKEDYELWKDKRVQWASPFKLVDMNGHTVCLIGLTTNDTLTDGNIESMKKLSFIDYNAAVNYSKAFCYEAIGEEEFNKIDAFILDTHLACQAIDDKHPFEGVRGEAVSLAENVTTRVDGVLAAHSHMICSGIAHNKTLNKDIPVAQGGQAARRYVNTTLTFDDSKKPGNRLVSVKMDVVKPQIDGTKDPEHPDHAAAAAQIKKILDTTTNQVVKNVAKVYEEKKAISKQNLDTVIGTLQTVSGFERTAGEEQVYGMPYWYTENDKKFGTKFLQSHTLLEPAGVWANIAMLQAFNRDFAQEIEAGVIYPAAVALTNLDSIKTGFYIKDGSDTKPSIKKDLYQMHAFENAINYGCLTPYQLKQYINYMLDGAGKFDYDIKPRYETTLYLDDQNKEELVWNDNEKTDFYDGKGTKTGTSFLSGLEQFHGLSFSVKLDETVGEFKKYSLIDDDPTDKPIKIYSPLATDSCDIYDPSTWININDWGTRCGGFIPMIFADFTWQGGNAQNRMIRHWVEYNAKKDPLAGYWQTNLYTRASALEYIEMLTEKGWKVNQVGDSAYIDEAYVKQFLKLPA